MRKALFSSLATRLQVTEHIRGIYKIEVANIITKENALSCEKNQILNPIFAFVKTVTILDQAPLLT